MQIQLLKSVPSEIAAKYIKLRTKLDAYRAQLVSVRSGRGPKSFRGLLRCAGSYIALLSRMGFGSWNNVLKLLFTHTPQVEEKPSVWEKEPVVSQLSVLV